MPQSGLSALTPEIEDFRRQFQQIAADAEALTAPLSDEQFTRAPAPGAWSIAQCLDHLNSTARAYLPAIDEGIADAISRGLYAEGPFTYNWIGRMFVRVLEPPPRFKAKAPQGFFPQPDRSREEILAAFRAFQVQFVDRLRQANGLDLARARVASPVNRWIRVPLGSAFALTVAHERRHLWQANAVRSARGFPR